LGKVIITGTCIKELKVKRWAQKDNKREKYSSLVKEMKVLRRP
jgi:hypothetical protein